MTGNFATSGGGVFLIILSLIIVVSIILLYYSALPIIKHILRINSVDVANFQTHAKMYLMENQQIQTSRNKYLKTLVQISPITGLFRKCTNQNPLYISPNVTSLIMLIGIGITRFIFIAIIYYSSSCNRLIGNIEANCIVKFPLLAVLATSIIGVIYCVTSTTVSQMLYIKELIRSETYPNNLIVKENPKENSEIMESIRYFVSFTIALLALFLEGANIYFGSALSINGSISTIQYYSIPFFSYHTCGYLISGYIILRYMQKADCSILIKPSEASKISSNDNRQLIKLEKELQIAPKDLSSNGESHPEEITYPQDERVNIIKCEDHCNDKEINKKQWGYILDRNPNASNFTSPKKTRNFYKQSQKDQAKEKENVFASPNKYRIKEQIPRYKKFVEQENELENSQNHESHEISVHYSPGRLNQLRDSQLNVMISYSLTKPISHSKIDKNDTSPKANVAREVQNYCEKLNIQNSFPEQMESEDLNKGKNEANDCKLKLENCISQDVVLQEINSKLQESSVTKENNNLKDIKPSSESIEYDKSKEYPMLDNISNHEDIKSNTNKRDILSRESKRQNDDLKEIQMFPVAMDNTSTIEQNIERHFTPAKPANGENITQQPCYFNSGLFKLQSQQRCESKECNTRNIGKQSSNTQITAKESDIEILDATINADALLDKVKDVKLSEEDEEEYQAKEILPVKIRKSKLKQRQADIANAKKPPKIKRLNRKPKINDNLEFDINEQKRIVAKYLQIAKSENKEKEIAALTEIQETLLKGTLVARSKIIYYRYLEMINSPYMQGPITLQFEPPIQNIPVIKKRRGPSGHDLRKLSELERLYSRGSQRSSSSDVKSFKTPCAFKASSDDYKAENTIIPLKELKKLNPIKKGSLKGSSYNAMDTIM